MQQETITVKFNEPLARRIEAFLEQHPEYGNLEDFVTCAGRIRREQLAATLPQGPATGPQNRDQEYSQDAVERAVSFKQNGTAPEGARAKLLRKLSSQVRIP